MKRFPKKGYTRRRPSPRARRRHDERREHNAQNFTIDWRELQHGLSEGRRPRPKCADCGCGVVTLLGLDPSRGAAGVFVCAKRGFVDPTGRPVLVDRHAIERGEGARRVHEVV